MPVFDFLQARCIGGDPTSLAATTAGATEYLTGKPSFNPQTGTYGTAVDEIDLGAGSGTGGTPGAGFDHALFLYVAVTAITGANGFTVTVTTDDNTTHASDTARFTTPTITATGAYIYQLPNLPERYAYIKTITGAASTATLLCALVDGADTRMVTP